ncbi:MAG: hypothetical protein RLZZ517_490 [Candidatus Parcubacteria bacterium]|jgi:hypothetical protein
MQDTKTLEQKIREYEANMPAEIMDIIRTFDWKKEVRVIVSQNQLMIDIGGDLEQTIYLVLLGVVSAQDFYERLVDGYEIAEDKAQKILEETENQIFNPLYKKIMELDEKTESNPVSTPSIPTSSVAAPHRDEILAEIEKEPEPLIKLNFSPKKEESVVSPSSPAAPVNPAPVANVESVSNPGVVKSFTLSPEKTVQVEAKQIEAPVVEPVKTEEVKPVETALTKPTVASAPKNYSVDPYREPIE